MQTLESQSATEAIVDPPSPQAAVSETPAYNWYVAALVATAYAVHSMDRNILNVLQESIKHEFHLSDSALGLLTGLGYAVPFAIAGVPLGALADRTSRKRLLAVLVTVWSLFTALGGLAGGYAMLLATRMAVGAAESGTPATAMALLSDYFPPRRRATAISIFYMGAPIGGMAGALLGGAVATAHGWRAALLVAALPGLLVAAVMALTIREPVRGGLDAQRTGSSPTLGAVFAHIGKAPGLALILAALVFASMAAVGVNAWTAVVVMRAYGLPVGKAGAYIALLGLPGLCGTLAGGLLADRFAKGRTERLILIAGGVQLAAILPLWLALSAHTLSGFTAPFVAWAFIYPIYLGAGYSLAVGLAPPRMRGRLMAITVVACNILGAGMGPQIVGLLSDALKKAGDPSALPHAVSALGLAVVVAGGFFLAASRFVPKGVPR